MLLAGLNSIGLNLNSLWLARRAEYMDVFCNPVSYVTGCLRYFRRPAFRPSGRTLCVQIRSIRICRRQDEHFMSIIRLAEQDSHALLKSKSIRSSWAQNHYISSSKCNDGNIKWDSNPYVPFYLFVVNNRACPVIRS